MANLRGTRMLEMLGISLIKDNNNKSTNNINEVNNNTADACSKSIEQSVIINSLSNNSNIHGENSKSDKTIEEIINNASIIFEDDMNYEPEGFVLGEINQNILEDNEASSLIFF